MLVSPGSPCCSGHPGQLANQSLSVSTCPKGALSSSRVQPLVPGKDQVGPRSSAWEV